ncbi:MAG: flagellar protein FlaG [Gammaproteobacteria bacterium]
MINPLNNHTSIAAPSDASRASDAAKPASDTAKPAVPPATPADGAALKLDPRALDEAVNEIARESHIVQRSLRFTVDEESGRTIITVVDRETEEVIRQIPAEEVRNIAARLRSGDGILLKETA